MADRPRALMDVPLEDLDDGPNVRAKADADLKRSIAEHGVLQPITVAPTEDGRFVVLYGHRRTAAARALRHRTIPAVVERQPANLPIRQLVENQQRRAVNPLDVARTLRAYLDEHPDVTQVELGRQLGRSQYWVTERLKLLDMAPELQAKVAAGETGIRRAYDTHKATTTQEKAAKPRSLAPVDEGRSASVSIELGTPKKPAKATIGIEAGSDYLDLVLTDDLGRGIMLSITRSSARLLARRLQQAVDAMQALAPAS